MYTHLHIPHDKYTQYALHATPRASPVAQLVENPPAIPEAWVQFLGWEDPLEKGKATHFSILTWRIPQTAGSMGSKESDMTEQLSLSLEEKLILSIKIKVNHFKTDVLVF